MGLRRAIKSCAVAVAALALLGAGPAPTVTNPPVSSGHHLASLSTLNRHLHGVPPAKHTTTAKPKEHAERGHHVWHSRWDYWGWAAAHHGVGTIIGTVYNKEEQPVPHAHVVLRSPKGHYLRWSLKHITTADSSGHFIMRKVRPGAYRIHASSGKSSGNTQIHVNSGAVLHEMVRF